MRVVYRACAEAPGAKARPAWFDKEACFARLAAETEPADLLIVWDSARQPRPPAFLRAASYAGARLESAALGSDLRSLVHASRLVEELRLPDREVVYFAEDDYLHRPGWAAALVAGLDVADYATLYDHPDKYPGAGSGLYRGLRAELFLAGGAHWRSTPSTTNTWATRAGTLRADAGVHARFLDPGLGHCIDHEKFLALGAEAGRRLASRVPALATHAQSDVLAPCVDWAAEAVAAAGEKNVGAV